MLCKVIGARTYSAQEVAHILTGGGKFFFASRTFVKVRLDGQRVLHLPHGAGDPFAGYAPPAEAEEEEEDEAAGAVVRFRAGLYEQYLERDGDDDEFAELTLMQFAARYTCSGGGKCTRREEGKEAIVQRAPHISPTPPERGKPMQPAGGKRGFLPPDAKAAHGGLVGS